MNEYWYEGITKQILNESRVSSLIRLIVVFSAGVAFIGCRAREGAIANGANFFSTPAYVAFCAGAYFFLFCGL
jgi:hypothetical protein